MKSSVALVLLLLIASPAAAETISGQACYRFSKQESLGSARDTVATLAKRNALETYSVFVDAMAAVQEPALRNVFVTSLMAELLSHVRTTSELVMFEEREVCRTITANVEPMVTIERVMAKMNTPQAAALTSYPWFPENDLAHVMEAIPLKRGDKKRVVFLFKCKRRQERYLDSHHAVRQERFRIRLVWIDHDGRPGWSLPVSGDCMARNAVSSIDLPLPPWDFQYWIQLPPTTQDFASWAVH